MQLATRESTTTCGLAASIGTQNLQTSLFDSSSARMPVNPRLDSLTSLRFLAAAMVVICHSAAAFHVDPHNITNKLGLSQGVSFFFVLSGFILTYVYRDLTGVADTFRFLSARIARVWPVFVFSVAFTYVLAPQTMYAHKAEEITSTLLSQFFMIHARIPERHYQYFSLNAPSWSVSTEFFFYLAFPLLIVNLRKNWVIKFFALAALPCLAMIFCHNAQAADSAANLARHWLIYISPVSRMFEFYVGMVACLALESFTTQNLNRRVISLFEVLAFGIVTCNICGIESWLAAQLLNQRYPELYEYLYFSGNCLGFALLIAVIALERGLVSKVLNLPILIFLGEVSYSVYLLHYPLLVWYKAHAEIFIGVPRLLRYGMFWAILISLSSAAFYLLEKPARDSMRRIFDSVIEKLPR